MVERNEQQKKQYEEVREAVAEWVLEIRQYLCNTEFAPEPFTEEVDINKLKVEFPDKILSDPHIAIVDTDQMCSEVEEDYPFERLDEQAKMKEAGWCRVIPK